MLNGKRKTFVYLFLHGVLSMRTNFQSVFRKRQKTEPIHLKYSMRFGFTLMELMVSIVVLLAIMIAVLLVSNGCRRYNVHYFQLPKR